MEKAISASEANQHFSELLREVSEGGSFTVTSRGRPVARITPVDHRRERQAVDQLLAFVRNLPQRRAEGWSRADLYD